MGKFLPSPYATQRKGVEEDRKAAGVAVVTLNTYVEEIRQRNLGGGGGGGRCWMWNKFPTESSSYFVEA